MTQKKLIFTFFFILSIFNFISCEFSAGSAKVEMIVPDGTPLAGYNHGLRRVPDYPIPEFRVYSTFLNPKEGSLDPIFAKALVVDDGNGEKFCFVTLDLMCADNALGVLAHAFAKGDGFSLPFDRVSFSGSHTHSSYGSFYGEFAMAITPTTDFFVPKVQQMMARAIADAMVQAEKSMVKASIGFGSGLLSNITRNRRSKYPGTHNIDPHFTVLAVNDASTGEAIATLFNFAIHGTCYGASNMESSADIMGVASEHIEKLGGGFGLFINADAGDISPCCGACDNKPIMKGGITMANKAMEIRSQIEYATSGKIQANSKVVNFGQTQTNFTLSRNTDINCTLTDHGPLNICLWCKLFDCTINLKAGQGWLEQTPQMSAIAFQIGGKSLLVSTFPVEAITAFGSQVRSMSQDLGFDEFMFAGYTNSYMMYLTTPDQYVLGGYEALLTLWGIHESEHFLGNATEIAKKVTF